MPRISPLVLRRAQAADSLLAQLLPVCRELGAAQNELRWLREHAAVNKEDVQLLVHRRAQGEPLQYILGSEYFGEIEVACRPGVLIPRHETAASVMHLVRHHLPKKDHLRVLDLCTGTGCIPLLFHHEYFKKHSGRLDLTAVDVSDTALTLAEDNKHRQLAAPHNSESRAALERLHLVRADVMNRDLDLSHADVLISNPPYISAHDFKTTTASSVRRYEPKVALVPSSKDDSVLDGDQLYPHMWHIADKVQAELALFEVGDSAQAERVADMGAKHKWKHIELWRDQPGQQQEHGKYNINGQGNVRSVFARR